MATKPHGKARRRHCGPIQAKRLKEKYQHQFVRTERNRKRKRVKHLSLHPADIQALAKYKQLLLNRG